MKLRHRISTLFLGLAILLGILLASFAKAKPPPQEVTIHFAQTEIATIIVSLAATVGFDVVIGTGVDGIIDINLTDVDWQTALDALASANGLAYRWEANVLVVVSADNRNRGDIEHHVVELEHADPLAIQQALTKVLSSRGSVELLGGQPSAAIEGQKPAARLIISEVRHHLPAVLAVIDDLDVRRPQFEITVKFIETDLDEQEGLGINWPTRLTANLADYENLDGTTSDQNQPTPAAEYNIPDGKIWKLGTLSINQLTGFIEFLEQDGNSRLLSDPRVTVLENETANMRVTTTFPIQTVTRFTEGAIIQDIVDFQDLEVGITLSVTPRLNDSTTITLDVEPVIEEITGFTGPTDNQRPIRARRTVKTTVRVENEETIVLGGLVRETQFQTHSGIWLLKDIPLLGSVFSHTKTEKKKTDLLIFITPRIVAEFAGS